MDNIKQLEKIGLSKVSEETHIEQKYLKYMVDGNFEKLSRINTIGFAKILSREYKINLDTWIEAFEEYWQENHKDDKNNDKLFLYAQDTKESKKLLKFIVLVMLVSLVAFVFTMFKDKINLDNYYSSDENSTSIYEQTSVVEETKKTLADYNEINGSDTNEVIQEEENVLDEVNQTVETVEETATVEVVEEIVEKVLEVVKVEEVAKVTEDVKVAEAVKVAEITQVAKDEIPVPQKNDSLENKLILKPTSKLWSGIIFFDDKTRESHLGEKEFTIDLTRDQIITNGHGGFELTSKDDKKVYNRELPIRFIVKDGKLSEITGDRFKQLNKGKLW